jgi:mannose-6-phosphate isomerase-like protein (cupin superfamily)
MLNKRGLLWLGLAMGCALAPACQTTRRTGWQPVSSVPNSSAKPAARVMRITDLRPNDLRLMPQFLGDKKIDHGGVYIFQPGETAHPEPVHKHDAAEVFIFIQGKGVIPIDGREYPVKTGDIVIVQPGEDHHTRSSVDDPLVAAWYVMEK